MTDPQPDDEVSNTPVVLTDDEQELVAFDLDALLPTLSGAQQERFTALRVAVDSGTVPADLTGALESLLELALQTGRARTRYRADGEQTLTSLYRKTPAGKRLSTHLGLVNQALRALQGEQIESMQVRMRTVGHFTLAIQTDKTSITLAARPDTVNVESIAVSG